MFIFIYINFMIQDVKWYDFLSYDIANLNKNA